ncbi:FprA family A-type flavoprotein [Breznakiellaceae bacterium SP9]
MDIQKGTKAQILADGVYCIHADICNNELFEGIWPIPDGVSINAYIVKGEKTALIDLLRDWDFAPQQFDTALDSIGLDFTAFDYLILNHLEPDHTGWLKEFRERNPNAQIIATAKGVNLIKSFYKIETGLRAVKDGDVLDLGNGKVLTFFETPNLHWPETMVTWDEQTGTLFSCDAFGSFGALADRICNDEFTDAEHVFYEKECLRYYTNIVCSFSSFVEKAIAKLSSLSISIVAPSHGIVWRKGPEPQSDAVLPIIERYARYAGYAKGPAERSIAVIWGSMYGNTRAGLDAVIRGIESEGIPYTLHRVPDDNISYILSAAYKSSALVFAMPTYEYAMFPPMSYVLDIFRRKHIIGKKVLRIGSWGWIGGAKKDFEAAVVNLQLADLDSYEWPGFPTQHDLDELEEKGRQLARKLKS